MRIVSERLPAAVPPQYSAVRSDSTSRRSDATRFHAKIKMTMSNGTFAPGPVNAVLVQMLRASSVAIG